MCMQVQKTNGCHACKRQPCWASSLACPSILPLAYNPTLLIKDVSDELRVYVRDSMRCQIRAREAGGGGDCLFHSCAAVLERMLHSEFDAMQHVLFVFSTPTLLQNFTRKKNMVTCLRSFSAQQFATWLPEAFLDYVLRAALDKRLGSFEDSWDPEKILLDSGFTCLKNYDDALAESVLAYEEQLNGDAKLRIAFTVAQAGAAVREERLVRVPYGCACYKNLLRDVQEQYEESGNSHWGTQCDVQHLSSKLNIGILMFCDRLQLNSTQCLYNIGAQREDFPYWIALWWQEPVHFRVAEVANEDQRSYTCFWSASELPESLLQEYRRCNRLAN